MYFLDLEAQFHLTADMRNVLPELLEQLDRGELRPERHAALALMAVIVAENVLDMEAAARVHGAIVATPARDHSPAGTYAVARMIYHASFGDLEEAGALATALVSSVLADKSPPLEGLQRLRWGDRTVILPGPI